MRHGGVRHSCRSGATYCPLHGQGAAEYLVLFAVVLIVALVSVALLGFFPGMAGDAQIAQSQMYWQSAQPIAITETAARVHMGNGVTYAWIRMKNTGAYPIRITALVGADGLLDTQFFYTGIGWVNISDYFYLGPGEDAAFAGNGLRQMQVQAAATDGSRVGGASSVCQNSSSTPGTISLNSFGFKYIEYIEGQQITKRQVGKPLIIRCI